MKSLNNSNKKTITNMITFSTLGSLIFLTTLWCCGLFLNSGEGDALYFLNKFTAPWGKFGKPVIHCINCMASLHSIVVITLYFSVCSYHEPFWKYILTWPIVTAI